MNTFLEWLSIAWSRAIVLGTLGDAVYNIIGGGGRRRPGGRDPRAEFGLFYRLIGQATAGKLGAVGIQEVAERLLADLKLPEHQDALAYFKHCCSGLARGRTVLFISSTGCLCSGSKGIVVGDGIALVAGVPLPLILRAAEGESQAASAVVGPAFVLGIMDGEAWRPEASAEIVADMRTKEPPHPPWYKFYCI